MDFGRAPPVSNVDYPLAPLVRPTLPRAESGPSSASPPRSGPLRVYMGCPVWNHASWVGKVYPDGSPQRDHLIHYARMFDSIELNATFYKIPLESTVERWRDDSPPDFRFVAKIPKQFSHDLSYRDDPAGVRAFLDSIAHFGERRGPVFLQLPPDFAYADRAALVRFVRALPRADRERLAVEFRHPSWFAGRQPLERMAGWFASEGVSIVVSDTIGRRDVSHGTLTADFLMVRFAGNELHPSDFERLDAWVERFIACGRAGLREVYFFAHEPDEVLCPELCAALALRLDRVNAEASMSGLPAPFAFRFTPPARVEPATPDQLPLF